MLVEIQLILRTSMHVFWETTVACMFGTLTRRMFLSKVLLSPRASPPLWAATVPTGVAQAPNVSCVHLHSGGSTYGFVACPCSGWPALWHVLAVGGRLCGMSLQWVTDQLCGMSLQWVTDWLCGVSLQWVTDWLCGMSLQWVTDWLCDMSLQWVTDWLCGMSLQWVTGFVACPCSGWHVFDFCTHAWLCPHINAL